MSQAKSLINEDLDLSYFTIKGKGIVGYLKSVPLLRKKIKQNNFDIIHAHYSMSGFVASLARVRPLIVSLMGTDVKAEKKFRFIIKLCYKFSWFKTIVKSTDMKKTLNLKNINVIPNGVDINKFMPIDRKYACKKIGWDLSKKNILFASNPTRVEKNFPLAQKAFTHMKTSDIQLHYLNSVNHKDMPNYMNASDVVLLTSKYEGSPNVIKEAMACNRPIVSTNVGDVELLIKNLKGCFITKNNSLDIANKIDIILNKYSNSNGRNRIIKLRLDSENIAKRICAIYKEINNKFIK